MDTVEKSDIVLREKWFVGVPPIAYRSNVRRAFLSWRVWWYRFSHEEKRHLFVAALFFFALTNALAAGSLGIVSLTRIERGALWPFPLWSHTPAFYAPRGVLPPSAFDGIIQREAERNRIDPRLVRAVIAVESGFNPRAVSRKGARGLMQLMPATAAKLQVRNAFLPEENIRGGTAHLAELFALFGGDLRLTLAAYNAGAEAVRLHRGVPPYRETRMYVERVLEIYRNYQQGE